MLFPYTTLYSELGAYKNNYSVLLLRSRVRSCRGLGMPALLALRGGGLRGWGRFAKTVAIALGIADQLELPMVQIFGPMLAMLLGKDSRIKFVFERAQSSFKVKAAAM